MFKVAFRTKSLAYLNKATNLLSGGLTGRSSLEKQPFLAIRHIVYAVDRHGKRKVWALLWIHTENRRMVLLHALNKQNGLIRLPVSIGCAPLATISITYQALSSGY